MADLGLFTIREEDGGAVVTGAREELECLILPKRIRGLPVVAIDRGAFAGQGKLRLVGLPEGLTQIRADAFRRCWKLERVALPDGLQRIERGAFAFCNALKDMSIPSSVTEIAGDSLPTGMYSDAPLFLAPQGVLVRALVKRTYTAPPGTTIVAERALADNIDLIEAVFPEGVRALGAEALAGCDCLRRVALPHTLEGLGEGAFTRCGRLEALELPAGLKFLPPHALENCVSLKSVVLPEKLEDIGEHAFAGCGSLTEVLLPERLRGIGRGTFQGCGALETLILPPSVASVAERALAGCRALKCVVLCGSFSDAMPGLISDGCRAAIAATQDAPEAFPGLWRKRVCLGYVRARAMGIAYAPEAEAGCIAWIRAHSNALLVEALKDAALLHLLAECEALTLSQVQFLLDRTEDTEYAMTLLDYRNRRFGSEQGETLSLW